ncbi:(2Fe-2S)-binding protein [Clostridium subterminale]|uniref:(2Fe-2S)-binding protein n=1 Tax=Clostridium subterminale TaxID=1550 RepID=A0ABN1KY01_CLOSU
MDEQAKQEALRQAVLDKHTKVCICRVVSKAVIKKAIADGAKSFEDVKKITGAGSGSCKGMRCKHKIEELLKEYK